MDSTLNQMQENAEQLETVFKKNIELQLQKINTSDATEREKIYKSALKSLKKINETNPNLPMDIKDQRVSLIENVIIDLEKNFLANNLASDPSGEIITKEGRTRWFSVKYILFFILASIAAIFLYKQFSGANNNKNDAKFELPHQMVIDDKFFKIVVIRGLGKAEIINEEPAISYTVGEKRDAKLESLDIIIRDKKLIEYLQSQNEPLVLTFDIQKVTNADMSLDILLRGLGQSVRQDLVIYDKQETKLFIAANTKNSPNKAKNILIRFTVKSKPGDKEKDVKFLIKNLTFDSL